MTPRDLRNIHTTGNSIRDALPCANMALNLPRYFYLLMDKPLGRYFQVRSSYYQAAQCNQKTLQYPQGDRSGQSGVCYITGQSGRLQNKIKNQILTLTLNLLLFFIMKFVFLSWFRRLYYFCGFFFMGMKF